MVHENFTFIYISSVHQLVLLLLVLLLLVLVLLSLRLKLESSNVVFLTDCREHNTTHEHSIRGAVGKRSGRMMIDRGHHHLTRKKLLSKSVSAIRKLNVHTSEKTQIVRLRRLILLIRRRTRSTLLLIKSRQPHRKPALHSRDSVRKKTKIAKIKSNLIAMGS
jgi:hypothetical protein